MGDILQRLLRTGSGLMHGLGAAGRDIYGQMSGSTGPTNSRWQNIIANEANPLGMLQTGQAFARGFSDGYGGNQMPSGTFDRARSDISTRAGSSGSVVGRGFVGDGRGNAAVQRAPANRAPTDHFGGTPGQPAQRPAWQMPGTNPPVGLMGSSAQARSATNAAMSNVANAARNTQGAGSTEEWLAGDSANQETSTRLGAGQLGSGGDAFLSDHMRAIFNRGGTTQEQ